jgi:hypothetical protein
MKRTEKLLSSYKFELLRMERLSSKIKEVEENKTIQTSLYNTLVKIFKTDVDKLRQQVELLETKLSKLNDVDAKLSLILTYYYMDSKTIYQIGKLMGYEEQTIAVYKRDAINLFESLWDKL